jgi:hypothetical protein
MHPYSIVLLDAWLCFQFIATVTARYNYPLSSTTKSYLRPLRAGLRSNEYSNTEEHTGSESPPSEGSSNVKYDRGRRALPLPLPVDIMGFLPKPIPVSIPVPVLSTSTSEYPPPDSMTKKRRGRKKGNTTDFIARAVEKHGDQYDFSLSEYGETNQDKVVILCTRHDPPVAFEMSPSTHLSGQGCRVCWIERSRGSTADFIARAVEKHGDQYDYSLSEYGKTSQDKVVILCTRHDPPVAFEMSPNTHLSGSGCRVCSIERSRGSTADFIARAVEKHGDQYDYSLSEYGKGNNDKVVILCTRHDPPVAFEQRPSNHLSGQGCPLCNKSRSYSKEAIKWLDYVANQSNPPIVIKHAENGGEYAIRYRSNTYFADGYCAETNTVYEFHGSYWHGDPTVYQREEMLLSKTAGQLYDETIERENIIKSLGYNLVVMWESEWNGMV